MAKLVIIFQITKFLPHILLFLQTAAPFLLESEQPRRQADCVLRPPENAAVSLLYENSEEEFYKKLPVLRKEYSDMELLRAAHFRSENERAAEEAEALSNGDTERFFELVDRSGASSAELLRDSCDDGLALGVMLSRRFLGGNGAVRIQSGMIQAFVPNYLAEEYAMEMERLFGFGNCYVLSLRNAGGYELEL